MENMNNNIEMSGEQTLIMEASLALNKLSPEQIFILVFQILTGKSAKEMAINGVVPGDGKGSLRFIPPTQSLEEIQADYKKMAQEELSRYSEKIKKFRESRLHKEELRKNVLLQLYVNTKGNSEHIEIIKESEVPQEFSKLGITSMEELVSLIDDLSYAGYVDRRCSIGSILVALTSAGIAYAEQLMCEKSH
jgi:hypothetical protein